MIHWHHFESREAASRAAAQRLAAAIREHAGNQERPTIVLSGGNSPQGCYQYLGQMPLDWTSINVTLTDERCVPVDHADSNTGMLHRHLMQGPASAAQLIALSDLRFADLPSFVAVLLGMGEDGHFASLFPDADNLSQGLDLQIPPEVLQVRTAASPHLRISLNLSALLRTESLLLLVFGQAKRDVLRRAQEVPSTYPIGALVQQQRCAVEVLYAD